MTITIMCGVCVVVYRLPRPSSFPTLILVLDTSFLLFDTFDMLSVLDFEYNRNDTTIYYIIPKNNFVRVKAKSYANPKNNFRHGAA